jgi:hypothetical protein
MEPDEFESFWRRVLAAQGENIHEAAEVPTASNVKVRSRTSALPEDSDGSRPNQLRATINKEGLDCVEGSPRAVADFLQLVSNWEASAKPAGKV